MSDLYTDQLKAMILAAGGNVDDLPDNLYSTLLERLAALGGSGGGAGSNPNLLINANFAVNQRNASGTITTPGFFVDRWQLVSGSVTINSSGSLTLDGTIKQILEKSIGKDFTASASAGVPTYDDVTKTFTLTASGETINWTKLEVGVVATAYSLPNYAEELVKCQRYFAELNLYKSGRPVVGVGSGQTTTRVNIMANTPVSMRTNPTVKVNGSWALRTAIEGGTPIAIDDMTVNTYTTLNSTQCVVLAIGASADTFTAGTTYYLQGNRVDTSEVYPSIWLDAEITG